MNFDQVKPGLSDQLRKPNSCLPSFYEEMYSTMDRLPQTESQNRINHKTIQSVPSTSAYSHSQENKFAKTRSEDISLNLSPTFLSPVDLITWQRNQQTYIQKIVRSKTSELFEHTYARSSHEENDSERSPERLTTESSLDNIVCPLQQNDSNINLNKSLLEESSHQATADSSLRLSEGNGASCCTPENNIVEDIETSSDADLLMNFVNSTFADYSDGFLSQNNQTNLTQPGDLSNISLQQTASKASEPFEVLQTLSERSPSPVTEITPLENSQPNISSNSYDVSHTSEEQSNQLTLMRNLINSIVQPFALSPLCHIFEAARISTAEVEDGELLMNFYNTLLETMITAQTQNNIQPSCSQVLDDVEENQNKNENYPKAKEMPIPKIMSGTKMKSWKNVIIKRYLINDNLPPDSVPSNEFQMNNETSRITRKNVQPCTNESRMILRSRNNVCYHEDSDSNCKKCFAKIENKKLSSTITRKSTRTNTHKMDPIARVGGKKLSSKIQGKTRKKTLQTIFSDNEKRLDESFSGASSINTGNITTRSKAVQKVIDINYNIIWPTDSNDGMPKKNFVSMGEARNSRPNILSALMNFKHDYFLFRRQVMQDFNTQAQIKKKSRKKKVSNFKAERVNRRSIKLKVSRFFNGFYNSQNKDRITKSDVSGKWTYRVCQVDKNTVK